MSLLGLFDRRSLESPARPLTDATLLDALGGVPGDAGIAVTETTAMRMSAVFRCVSLIASVGGSLPLHAYREGTKERVESQLLNNPHPDLTPYELWRITYVHRALWGNAYLQIERSRGGQVLNLHPITPDRCEPVRVPRTTANPWGKIIWVVDDWGKREPHTPREVLHLPGLGFDGLKGYSPIRLAAQGIGLAVAAEKFGSKLFGSGNLLSGILTTKTKLQDEDARRLQARWQAMSSGVDRAGKVGVLDSGAEFQNLTMPNDDAQLLESRRFQVSEIARFYGVPPFLLMETEKSTSWGTGLEQQAIGWIKFDLHPQWLAPTEQRVTKEILGQGTYGKYVVEGLLRGDSKARAEFYRTMREVGAFSANDIRELEDMTPVEHGDTYLEPMNYRPLGSDPDEDEGASSDEGNPDEPDDSES